MYKIGEFSILGKTTIKTLRYYEKEQLLIPAHIDDNSYRYYESSQLITLVKILSLRQIGLSIKEIKDVFKGANLKLVLNKRKETLQNEIQESSAQLEKINYLLEKKNMNYEVIKKELPEYTIYYKEGVVEDFSKLVGFILSSGEECLKLNPNIKCLTPDYCYVNYLDGEYKEKNIKVRYAQAVEEKGVESANIKFTNLKKTNAVCLYHKGSYDSLRDTYSFIMKYIEENNLEITDYPRERYIDGMWNKENVNDWLTEIQVPVK